MMKPVVVIAEIGECWNGEMSAAEQLIRAAAAAGCDYAKFQTLDREGVGADDPEREWFLKIALDRDQLGHLRQYAAGAGIGFLATPEKRAQAELLVDLGCTAVKIASSCLVDDDLLRYVNGRFERVFASTGLAELDEVDRAVSLLSGVRELYLLHCIAEYPTGVLLEERGARALAEDDVHLAMMKLLADRYPRAEVGYSDHTLGLLAPVAAVAAGARAIEKHVTLDRSTPLGNLVTGGTYLGTDHALSLEPDELREMVASIRRVERLMGTPEWRRSEGELKLRSFLRDRFRQPA